jgi:uridylate kinase
MALKSALEQLDVSTRLQSAIEMKNVAEPFILGRAIRHLELGRVVIFVAGTGNPYFSTDTTAALRASEIGADVLLKATKVDGVYDSDPNINPNAKRYATLTYDKVLADRLNVMDATAIVMCRDNRMPLQVFNLNNAGDLPRVVRGEDLGTVVTSD